ncbi:hypothetical protein DFP77_11283 [Marinomonas foliarum]|uniref:Uncharacterized protein n=2 Tax=Marinomonas foliarum TaxID=491950 RepID=A0A369A2W5_9GAMM|nr:hypothetical protein DFP77_11283 [Marinomonas foliarum]
MRINKMLEEQGKISRVREVKLKERIMGYSVSPARSGEMAQVQYMGATSTEDGDLHIKYLEGFPQTILSMIDEGITPADIKSMVVLISHDLNAKVYINELEVFGYVHVKAKKVDKGQALKKDDISGFERIKLGDIEFPDDHAYFCVLSLGWDKAYIFDFSPLDDQSSRKIEYDVEKFIGSYFSYLSFKTIHKISDSDWDQILKQNWFPFFSLKFSTIESIINYVRAGWDIDDLINTIEIDTLEHLQNWTPDWKKDEGLAPFVDFLERAIERHKSEDFISSTSIIYPKIEGLIRQEFIKDNPGKEGRRQNMLVEHITEKTQYTLSSLTTYIPDRFKRYLEECYFKDFIASSQNNQVSRHSVAHGASSIEQYGKKESLVGLLVFSQIAQYIKQSSNKSSNTDAASSAGS